MGTNPVRIGCYSAFWGDSVTAAEQLVSKEKSNLNYLVADYLAEVTMGLLARRKANLSRNLKSASNGGYISEFITLVIARLLPDIHKHNIKVITNAGGLDPVSCKLAIEALAADLKIPINVAAITGDDLLPRLNDLRESQSLKPFSPVLGSSPDALPKGDKQVLSLNAYLGAIPIARALDAGAQIVVTGRIVDSALVVGPLIHEFNWMATDYDKLASASLAGHIIECGAQATGGNYTDWEEAAFSLNGGYANMGYPIVECYPSGEFLVTKPSDTGGVVNVKSVTEQMLYEVLDPAMYILPDVILDLTRVKVEQVDETRVRVSGARGKIPTELLKVSGIYADGYKMTGEIVVCGIDAWKKSVVIANAILSRTRLLFVKYGMKDFRATNIEPLGAEHTYGPHARTKHTREVVLRLTVHHDDPQALKIFAMELVPVVAAATSMVPGITGGESGRPHPSPNLVHFSSLIPKGLVTPAFTTTKVSEDVLFTGPMSSYQTYDDAKESDDYKQVHTEGEYTLKMPLIKIAHGRSGDKGDTCNIGIIARHPKYYGFLKRVLTEETVRAYMSHVCKGIVKRYVVPGCYALNFVFTKSLGGGGLSSLRVDRQGKTFAQMLLSYEVEVPNGLISRL